MVLNFFRSYLRRPVSRGSSPTLGGPFPDSRPRPGRAVFMLNINYIRSYRRRPVSRRSSQPSAGPSLDPGLRRGERGKGGPQQYPLIPAKAGIQGIIHKRLQARPWTPAYAGGSGFYVEYQSYPLIPAKAGIQEIIHKRLRARPWTPAYAGVSGGKFLVFNNLKNFPHQHRQIPVHTAPGPCLPWRPRSTGRHGAWRSSAAPPLLPWSRCAAHD